MKQSINSLSARRHWLIIIVAVGLVTLGIALRPIEVSANRAAASKTRVSIELPNQPGILAISPEVDSADDMIWKYEKVRKGDSLSHIFKRIDLPASTLHEIVNSSNLGREFAHIKPGQTFDFGYTQEKFTQLKLTTNKTRSLSAILDNGTWTVSEELKNIEIRTEYAQGTIRDSLFVAGNRAGLSDTTIMQMAGIFGWDIDFALDIREGDRFTVLYEGQYIDGEKIGDGRIIAAEFINQGETHRAIYYTNEGEISDYYAPDGRAMRKAFLRTPVKFTRISSRFSKNRWHPILKKWRPHKGIDYAAAHGTPVLATSNGKVSFKGNKGGYGKVIFIQHGQKYTTVYGHLSRYAKGIRKGKSVKQGQTIGYVGSTGLATGPHLHYELRVDGIHRNPLTIKLPQAHTIARKYMPELQNLSTSLFNQLALLSPPPVVGRDNAQGADNLTH